MFAICQGQSILHILYSYKSNHLRSLEPFFYYEAAEPTNLHLSAT